jgi:hypothetical protein
MDGFDASVLAPLVKSEWITQVEFDETTGAVLSATAARHWSVGHLIAFRIRSLFHYTNFTFTPRRKCPLDDMRQCCHGHAVHAAVTTYKRRCVVTPWFYLCSAMMAHHFERWNTCRPLPSPS